MTTSPLLRRLAELAFCFSTLVCGMAVAGEVELKNGLLIEGTPVPVQGLTNSAQPNRLPTQTFPLVMIDQGFRRYFVSKRRVERIEREAELSRYVTYTLKHKPMARQFAVTTLGPISERRVFDTHGRRLVTLRTPKGTKEVIQGITKLTPKRIHIESLNVVWEPGIATSSVDPVVLDPILRNLTDADDPNDRMGIATFYLQAKRYPECDRELEAIRSDFPELKGRVEEIGLQLRQLWARELLGEIRRRRGAGQHRLAYQSAKRFPTKNMSAAVLRQVDEITDEYDAARVRGVRAHELLAMLQGQLGDAERVGRVAPIRTAIKRELDFDSLPRLQPFLNLAEDDTLAAESKVALAVSGWLLGAENAQTDLDAAMRLWDARFLLGEFLACDDDVRRREELLDRLLGTEGVNIPRLQQLIAHLPPVLGSANVRPGVASRVVIREATEDQSGLAYRVLLPSEYSPHRRYPLVVALHHGGMTPAAELEWWGIVRKFKGAEPIPGQSQRRGYVVIAPEYLPEGTSEYDYGAATHRRVLDCLRDARKRFRIDSDRVFLSGHGQGGNATFDIGMSHPDVFAGLIPITGISERYSQWYWQNTERLPMFVINGELDRDTPARNARDLTRMLKNGHDVVYCEYVGRGFESYFEEIHTLFDWMDRQRRARLPREFEHRIVRPTDNRFYWLEGEGVNPRVAAAAQQANAALLAGNTRARVRPSAFEASLSEANSLYVQKSMFQRHVLWLSPEMVDFEKRFTVRVLGRQKFNDFLEPSAEVMLEDLRIRGDREKLFTVRLELD